MPRIRTIKPKFWNDVKIGKLTRDARLIYIAMWNFADDNGVTIGDHTYLKANILPYDELKPGEFKKWMDELVKGSRIIPISENGEEFYFIPGFKKHQVINRPNYQEAFIGEQRLQEVLEDSRNNHGTFTDQSLQEGKGKEGKGEEGKGKEEKTKKVFSPPTIAEVLNFFNEKGYTERLARKFFDSYEVKNERGENWIDSRGNKVKNWKQKALMVWMKDSDKLTTQSTKNNGIAGAINNF